MKVNTKNMLAKLAELEGYELVGDKLFAVADTIKIQQKGANVEIVFSKGLTELFSLDVQGVDFSKGESVTLEGLEIRNSVTIG